uniref:Putative ovule protein n=1 Tax=Solanum chacoense TaxID=4108 RepID=A0A0V0GM78_SOLCH
MGFVWFLTGVYAPHTRTEKLERWEEIAAVRELCGGPWITCGDFNCHAPSLYPEQDWHSITIAGPKRTLGLA